MTAERIDMIRKSEYDELVREHLEAWAEIVGLEQQITQIQAQYQAKLKATEEALIKANAKETELYVENGRMRVLLQELRPGVERDATYAAHRLVGAADYPVKDEEKYTKMYQDAEALLERIDKMIGEQHG